MPTDDHTHFNGGRVQNLHKLLKVVKHWRFLIFCTASSVARSIKAKSKFRQHHQWLDQSKQNKCKFSLFYSYVLG